MVMMLATDPVLDWFALLFV